MSTSIKNYQLGGIDVYETYYGGKQVTDEEYFTIIDRTLEAVYEARAKQNHPFALISDLRGCKPTPKRKSYSKKLSKAGQNSPNMVCSVMVSTNSFLNLVIQAIRKDVLIVKNVDEAKKLILKQKGKKQREAKLL